MFFYVFLCAFSFFVVHYIHVIAHNIALHCTRQMFNRAVFDDCTYVQYKQYISVQVQKIPGCMIQVQAGIQV